MTDQEKNQNAPTRTKVSIVGYAALLFAILFFSGIFASQKGGLGAMDFNIVNGQFGVMKDAAKATFYGAGGIGARDGFLFAITLFPGVMLALGIVEVVDHLGGLKAAEKLLSPILRPLLGIPGITGLALVTSLQSTDAGADMTRLLKESGQITEKEKTKPERPRVIMPIPHVVRILGATRCVRAPKYGVKKVTIRGWEIKTRPATCGS